MTEDAESEDVLNINLVRTMADKVMVYKNRALMYCFFGGRKVKREPVKS